MAAKPQWSSTSRDVERHISRKEATCSSTARVKGPRKPLREKSRVSRACSNWTERYRLCVDVLDLSGGAPTSSHMVSSQPNPYLSTDAVFFHPFIPISVHVPPSPSRSDETADGGSLLVFLDQLVLEPETALEKITKGSGIRRNGSRTTKGIFEEWLAAVSGFSSSDLEVSSHCYDLSCEYKTAVATSLATEVLHTDQRSLTLPHRLHGIKGSGRSPVQSFDINTLSPNYFIFSGYLSAIYSSSFTATPSSTMGPTTSASNSRHPVNEIRYGTGRSLTKSDAKELAAKETLEIIYRQNAPTTYSTESYKWPIEGGGDHHYSYGYPIAASTSAYAPVTHPYIATPGTPAAGLQPLPTTSASPSHYAYPSQYPAYQYQPYYHTQHAPQQQTYYVYSSSDPYYRH
ncbi:2741_t:CDS:2 [Acaulospora colombiana]|uniref:2741_t:CDS:1 n=1 Tax=Acaulospora colombiana TaxID=27376 RepID=A0ACA9N549_9GLOM|nr:2741_t:CDS:2 [Acaulospora colombiana]